MGVNKGFSLVELIVALAIFAIAGFSVFGFMSYSSNNYTRTNSDIKLQYEQQLTVNQIRDEILEASRAIYYDSASSVLVIYCEHTDSLGNVTYPVKKITFNESENKLYIAEKIFTSVGDISLSAISDSKLLAENVSQFSADLSKVKRQKVSFTITFEDKDKKQTVSPVIALRNELKVSSETDAIYTGTKTEVKSFIKNITIHRGGKTFSQADTDEIKKYGDMGNFVSVQYTASVTATEDSTREYAVTWLVETTNLGISVNNGVVKISNTVSNGTPFILKAVSVDDPLKYAELRITVIDGGVYPESAQLDITNTYEGNGYREYTLTPTLTYTNGTKINDISLFTWKGVDSFPKGCNFDKEKGILYLTETANGYTFQIYVIANDKDVNNNPIVSNIIEINVGKIPPYKSGPTLKISSTALKRGDSVYPGVSWTNITNSNFTYYWKISPYDDAESTSWGQGTESFSNCITISSPDPSYASLNTSTTCVTGSAYRYASINCNSKLNWNKAFKIKVSVYALDQKGNKYEAKDFFITIPPVSIKLTPTDYAVNNIKTQKSMIIKGTDPLDYAIMRFFNFEFIGLKVTSLVKMSNYELYKKNCFQFYNNNDEQLDSNNYSVGKIFDNYEHDMVIGFNIERNNFITWKNQANRATHFEYYFYVNDKNGNEATSNVLNYLISYN